MAGLLVLSLLGGLLSLTALHVRADRYSGCCGHNVTRSPDAETGVLTFSGSGSMTDYNAAGNNSRAVLWAYSRNPKVANGTDATHFKKTCTRAEVVQFLSNANP